MEKEDPNNLDFVVPQNLRNCIKVKIMGNTPRMVNYIYVLRLIMISQEENQGIPALNGDGELIGLAFNGNWEAMASVIDYQTRNSKNHMCRYQVCIIYNR